MKLNKCINLIKEKLDLIRYILFKMSDMGLAFLLTLIIVKKLTNYEYGVYTLILTILGMLVIFGFSWTSSSLMYFGVEEKLKYGSLNRTFWSRNIILVISYSIIVILFIYFQNKINNYLTEKVSIYIFIWMTIRIFTDYLSSYFLAIEKREISILVTLTTKIVTLFLLFIINMTLKKMLIFSIVAELSGLIWLLKINKKDFGKFIFDQKIFKQVLSFGFWQLFGFSGLYLINFGDNLVIKHYLGVEKVGIYNISYQLFMGMAAFSYLFSNYFAPQVVKAIKEKNIDILNSIFKKDRFILVGILIIPHVIVIFLAKKIIISFYGVSYVGAIIPLIILTIESLLKYFTVFNILIYNCFKKYSFLQIINIIQASLNIGFDILFVPKFGIVGAAYATILSFLIVSIIETSYGEYILNKFKKEVLEIKNMKR
ncbi:oligosaccharide flippase family protein [Fusobacterium sp.]|uniref:lipopolysaccharide biosynthesis protein n=1 Tax=Fusobacterium sp. TaxID=68766 RepID=UPI0025C4CDCE|nr:oligosaccharide flippase family protein [Fusobacterium sp.]